MKARTSLFLLSLFLIFSLSFVIAEDGVITTPTNSSPSTPSIIPVHLNEKFTLIKDQSAILEDYKDLKVRYLGLNYPPCVQPVCAPGTPCPAFPCSTAAEAQIQVTIQTPSDDGSATTGQGRDLKMTAGQKADVFGLTLTLVSMNNKEVILLLSKQEVPVDVASCLNNQDNYWDQETNKCFSGFSKEMIKNSCSDPDGGINFFQRAHTYGFRSAFADDKDKRIRTGGFDACATNSQLLEYYCDGSGFIQPQYTDCPKGCDNGECIKGEPISEKITCKFENTEKEQKCYLAGQSTPDDEGTKFCKSTAGSGSCVITYSGYAGEKVTWKSTCGQYQYTTQDGTDEAIYFKCSEGETNTSEIKNNAFSFAYWKCQDGSESKSEDVTSCKPSVTWQKYASDFCNGKCDKIDNKCGVAQFSVWNDCYSDENIGQPTCGVGNLPPCLTESNATIIEPSLVCKDSCPLDGKCYPFGYRKAGDYCSDEGKFIVQLSGDVLCDNNFQCSSNVCVSGKCISEGFLERILNWFKKLFGG